MSTWKFFLANSSDLEIQKDITPEARSKQLTLSFNRSGAFSCNLPLTIDNYNNTFTNEKCVMVMKNGVFVWSGPVWARNIDLNTEKIDFSAVGWFEILMNRYLYQPLSYNGKDTTAAFNLLDRANQDIPTWITKGSSASSIDRNETFEQFQSVGEEILKLSDYEGGFDIEINPSTRQMNLTQDSYSDRTEIPFGYNWGPNNISNIVIQQNGGEMRNRVTVVGGNSSAISYPNSPNTSATSPSAISQSQLDNNLLAEIIQATEVTDSDIIEAYVNSEGAIKEFPEVTYEISLKPQGIGNPYEFFEDYTLGDKIYFTAQKQIEGQKLIIEYSGRVFGATINIDENGRETVSSLQMRMVD
jgi:hypothetical protein